MVNMNISNLSLGVRIIYHKNHLGQPSIGPWNRIAEPGPAFQRSSHSQHRTHGIVSQEHKREMQSCSKISSCVKPEDSPFFGSQKAFQLQETASELTMRTAAGRLPFSCNAPMLWLCTRSLTGTNGTVPALL